MNTNNLFSRLLASSYLLATTIFFTSCDPEKPVPAPAGAYEKGVFVINEGNFTKGNGAITFYNSDTKHVETDILNPKMDVRWAMWCNRSLSTTTKAT